MNQMTAIPTPHSIGDALDCEENYLAIVSAWEKLPEQDRVEKTLCNSEFYRAVCKCRSILHDIDLFKKGLL